MANLPPKDEAAEQKAQAREDLEHIGILRRFAPFTGYFMREPQQRIAELERRLRDRKLKEDERQFILGQLEVYERWKKKLDEDETANRSIAGI